MSDAPRLGVSPDLQRIADLIEIHQLCARYMAYAAQHLPDQWLEVFTPDAEYSAFGASYSVDRMPQLLEAAPRGQYLGNMPVVELDGDRATGVQHYVFIEQKTHAMRLAWYRDEYVRTKDGWRIRRRATTFMRKSGAYDSGRQHDPLAAPEGSGEEAR